MLAKSQ